MVATAHDPILPRAWIRGVHLNVLRVQAALKSNDANPVQRRQRIVGYPQDRGPIPGPGRPLFEDASANFVKNSPAKVDTRLVDRGPLLPTSGTEDHTVPLKVTREVYKMYTNGGSDTDLHEFEGRGHSLTIDHGWRDVADVTLQWLLTEKGF